VRCKGSARTDCSVESNFVFGLILVISANTVVIELVTTAIRNCEICCGIDTREVYDDRVTIGDLIVETNYISIMSRRRRPAHKRCGHGNDRKDHKRSQDDCTSLFAI